MEKHQAVIEFSEDDAQGDREDDADDDDDDQEAGGRIRGDQ